MKGKSLGLSELEKENRALKEQLELLNYCLDTLLFDGVTILDKEGKIAYVNKTKAERIGYTKGELIGIKPIEIVAERDLSRYVDEFEKALYKREIPNFFEYTVKHKNGKEIPMEIKFTVLYDREGEAIGAIGVSRDITYQRRIEQRLLESEEKYRLIFESTGTAMLTTSCDGTILLVNKEFEKLSGYSKEELSGKKKINDFIKSGLPRTNSLSDSYPKRYECLFINRSGKKKNLIVVENLISTERAKIISLMDITKNKKILKKLKEYQKQTKNLSTHLQNVIEQERTKLAHEIHDGLGQELTALKIQLSLLTSKLSPGEDALLSKVNSMINLVDDILNEARDISLSLSPVVLDHFGLEAAIRGFVEDFQKNTGIRCHLEYDFACNLPGNEYSLAIFRILQELMTNTALHSGASQADIKLTKIDNSLHLKFRDNGKGIPKSKIFSSNSFGLLGMRERVLFWGGSIKIKGKKNRGTEVTIRLPLPSNNLK